MLRMCLLCLMIVLQMAVCGEAAIPVIYSTDLFHPYDDPDDHYDLATLFALPELDVKGIIIDMSNMHEHRSYQKTRKKPAYVALQQMAHLTGKQPPVVTGLEHSLRSMDDSALNQPEASQGAVRMILSTLSTSQEKVSIFIVGSLVDLAAAYNREPDLLRQKVRAVYVNAGNGPDGYQEEWNVRLDQHAYRRIMLSDLPVRWYPCFGRDSYMTHFVVDQTDVLSAASSTLRAFFAYALRQSTEDPIPFLAHDYPPPAGPRNMWCLASFLDLAERRIYKTEKGFEALPFPLPASAKPIECYQMRRINLQECDAPVITHRSGVTIHYVGCAKDAIGTQSTVPDGKPDCQVRIGNLPSHKAILKVTVTGPRDGLWLDSADPKRWLVKADRVGESAVLSFSFWAHGPHELRLSFDDASTLSASFYVPIPGSPYFRADLNVNQGTVRVIRKRESRYTEVMTSVLKNLLSSSALKSHD